MNSFVFIFIFALFKGIHFMANRRIRWSLLILLLWGIIIVIILQFQKDLTHFNSRLPQNQNAHSLRDNPHYPEKPNSASALLQKLKNVEPKTAPHPVQSEDDIISHIQQSLPNLPISYWNRIRKMTMIPSFEPCAEFPNILNLEFNNLYWQTLHSSNGTFYLYGAYYDVRKLSQIGPAVRILGMINRFEPTVQTYCQIWFADHFVAVVEKTLEYQYIWRNSFGNYEQFTFDRPYLITCPIPDAFHHLVPVSVSLVEHSCNKATNNLRIIYNKAVRKERFAVCVKGLDFLQDDISIRLAEWIEMLNILGAHKVFFYKLHVHPNISKVLDYYVEQGKVAVTPFTLAGRQPNLAGLQHLYLKYNLLFQVFSELVPYNDCLYQNMYRYEYIVLLDIDEVIMPQEETNWAELMDTILNQILAVTNEPVASYNVRSVYFLDDFIKPYGYSDHVPHYMHMLQHVYRTKHFTPPFYFEKCFHNPEQILVLHNHFPIACLGQPCTTYSIKTSDALLYHYRVDCSNQLSRSWCDHLKQNAMCDATIWRYKDLLINRTVTALSALGLSEDGAWK